MFQRTRNLAIAGTAALLFLGLAFAQETEPQPPPPVDAGNKIRPPQIQPPKPQLKPATRPALTPQEPAPTGPQSKLELSQKEWDFGEVWQGEPAITEVTVKNVGEIPMTVEVRSSCGCTVPTRPKSPLQPGESDVMRISYNTEKRKGPTTQHVTITTNDPTQRSVAFTVKGTVKAIYDLKPRDGLVFGALTNQAAETRTVEISNLYTEKMVLSLKEGQDFGAFDVQLKEIEPGMKYEVRATTKPPLNDGKTRVDVVLLTQVTRIPELKIPINGFVQPPVRIAPNKLFLPKSSTTELQRPVYLYYTAQTPVKILEAKANLDAIRVEVNNTPREEKGTPKQYSYEIKVILPPGSQLPPDAKPVVEIKTDSTDERFKSFSIPIQMVESGPANPRVRPPTPPRPPGATSRPVLPPGSSDTDDDHDEKPDGPGH